MGNAARFMNAHLAGVVGDMEPDDELAVGEDNWAMASEGQVYLVYLKNGGAATVDLSGARDQEFSVQWFNPRVGGDLIEGPLKTVKGGPGNVSLGNPPSTGEQDWVVLLKRH